MDEFLALQICIESNLALLPGVVDGQLPVPIFHWRGGFPMFFQMIVKATGYPDHPIRLEKRGTSTKKIADMVKKGEKVSQFARKPEVFDFHGFHAQQMIEFCCQMSLIRNIRSRLLLMRRSGLVLQRLLLHGSWLLRLRKNITKNGGFFHQCNHSSNRSLKTRNISLQGIQLGWWTDWQLEWENLLPPHNLTLNID